MALTAVGSMKMVEPEFEKEAWLCRRIINKVSGVAFNMTKDPYQKWPYLYKWAKQNPDQFDIEMAQTITDDVDEDGNIQWTKEGLENQIRMSGFQKVRDMAVSTLGVTARDKETLIANILKKQALKKSEEE
jgi:hypothetical protein